jgi:uncharacterized protein (DUF952 family)
MIFFHITTAEAWGEALRIGRYRPESLARDGFIHLSEERQWRATAGRFFRGQSNLLLLALDGTRLSAEVRYEEADGDRFPHLYGELEVDGVDAFEISVGEDGAVGEPQRVTVRGAPASGRR